MIVTEVCGIFVYYHEAEHYLVKPTVAGMLENSTGQDAVSAGDWAIEAWGITQSRELVTPGNERSGGLTRAPAAFLAADIMERP